MKIALANIAPDPNQPRKLFSVDALEELAASLLQNGQLQDITVRPNPEKDGTFFVCYGERRWRAHKLLVERGKAEFAFISAKVTDANGTDLKVRQIVENIARADMTPLEEGTAFAALLDTLSPEEAARKLGISTAKFTARASLTKLEPSIAKLLAAKQISDVQAQEIARLPAHADQLKILRMLNRGDVGKWNTLKAAVDTILGPSEETRDMFGAAAPKVSAEEVKTLNAMEARIEKIASSLATSWRNGECMVAARVSPDKAALMAQKLATIRTTVRTMEQQLVTAVAQAKAFG